MYPTPPTSAAEAQAREIRSRHTDPRLAMQEIAHRLGHREVGIVVTSSGRRFFAVCACGWASNTAALERVAAQSAIAHIDNAVRAWHRSGRLLAELDESPVTIPWQEMARKYRHVEQYLAGTRSADRLVS